jgi:DNA-binding transcriptional MerR regulator
VKPRGATSVLAIGDLAREFAISTRAIRFYEARGLIHPKRRGQVRIFGPTDRQRLALIIRAKNLGLTLEEIGEHLALFDAAAATSEASILKARADKQIALLQAKRADLALAIGELRRLSAELGSQLRRARRGRS